MTPFDQLNFALFNDHDIAKATSLRAKYPDVLREDGQGIALLDSAAHDGDIRVLEFLVRNGVDVNATLSSALFHGPIVPAAMEGHHEAVKWFLEHGAEINPVHEGHRYCSALSAACICGRLKCVKVLVEGGADINACWADKNPLYQAQAFGHKAIVKYLRAKGAKLPSELKAAPSGTKKKKPKKK